MKLVDVGGELGEQRPPCFKKKNKKSGLKKRLCKEYQQSGKSYRRLFTAEQKRKSGLKFETPESIAHNCFES